ncbi:SH3 domain-binding protein 1-like isoform X1 [Cervus elaphus]|uniref:SH3 domain-binding protein 1-like isoform X1 n=1 Tax=Cervus canadensis TaxID=1574408 RepID=UPI001C9E207E|nr:SH3 domain-binding protein 1-like isoform X1 [Cervus canadensis]XP_043776021.1 SH3 domain-binding protein 1-like isoform X1 [Cervus elaphus]
MRENSPEIAERSPSGHAPLKARRPLPSSLPAAPPALSGCRSTPHLPPATPPLRARPATHATLAPPLGPGLAGAELTPRELPRRHSNASPRGPGRVHPGRGSRRPRPRLVSPEP